MGAWQESGFKGRKLCCGEMGGCTPTWRGQKRALRTRDWIIYCAFTKMSPGRRAERSFSVEGVLLYPRSWDSSWGGVEESKAEVFSVRFLGETLSVSCT